MNKFKAAKNVISGIFSKNYELGEINDTLFLQIIKAGIDEAAKEEYGISEELTEHAINKYTDIWLNSMEEDENEFDVDHEKEKARATFMKYFNRNET